MQGTALFTIYRCHLHDYFYLAKYLLNKAWRVCFQTQLLKKHILKLACTVRFSEKTSMTCMISYYQRLVSNALKILGINCRITNCFCFQYNQYDFQNIQHTYTCNKNIAAEYDASSTTSSTSSASSTQNGRCSAGRPFPPSHGEVSPYYAHIALSIP